MTEYVMVGRGRWERVQDAASELLDLSLAGRLIGLSSNDVADAVLPGDLDPVAGTLSDADREALARDICLIYDELDSGSPPPEGWCDKMHPQGWPYLLVDRLLTRWHIVRRTPEPGV